MFDISFSQKCMGPETTEQLESCSKTCFSRFFRQVKRNLASLARVNELPYRFRARRVQPNPHADEGISYGVFTQSNILAICHTARHTK
jgi:hypothetical protein